MSFHDLNRSDRQFIGDQLDRARLEALRDWRPSAEEEEAAEIRADERHARAAQRREERFYRGEDV